MSDPFFVTPTDNDLDTKVSSRLHQFGDIHRVGEALGTPEPPVAVGGAGNEGSSDYPARSDHVHPGPITESGTVGATFTAEATKTASVVFTQDFDTTPVVTLGLQYSGGSKIAAVVTSVSSTGFDLTLFETTGTNISTVVTVNWIAMEAS